MRLVDMGITLRKLARAPAFTLAAIVTLGVGIGATTSIFSTVNATLLRPLPFPNADELYTLNTAYPDGRFTNGRVAGAYLTAIAESAPMIGRAVATIRGDVVIRGEDGRSRNVLAYTVQPGFFELFGLSMAAGRAPVSEDGQVAVLSYRLWDEMFGRDPGVVDRTLSLATGSVRVVGVAPPELDLPSGTDVWFSNLQIQQGGTGHVYDVFLRVRPGATRAQLRTDLARVMARMGELYPATAGGRAFVETPLIEAIVGDLGPILVVVLAGAIVLLVLASVNVAMLMLARDATEARELALRAALGASRGRLVGRLLAESFTLAAVGAVFGAALAYAGVRLLLAFGAAELPRLERVPIDARVLLFAGGALVLAAVVVGLTPALRLANPDVRGLLGESGRASTGGRRKNRLLSGLIVAEIALATALVAGGGWLVRSYVGLAGTDPGFVAQGRLVFDASLAGSKFAPQPIFGPPPEDTAPTDPPVVLGTPATWLSLLRERLTASPQVTAVGAAATFPLRVDWDGSGYIGVPGEYDEQRQDNARRRPVAPGFFEAMGTRLVAGRTFTSQDSGFPPTAVVNEEFVRRYFPGRDDVVGASFAYGFPTPDFNNLITVLGVVADVRYGSLDAPAEPIVYVPGQSVRESVVVATTLTDPTPLIPVVRAAVNEIDPSVPVTIEPVGGIVSAAMLRYRLGLILMVLFAALSIGLAAVGVYGVIAHVVGQRSREMAIRMALGATPSTLVGQVLFVEGRAVIAAGVLTGVAAAYAGGRVIASRLYEVRAGDPAVLVVAVVAVLLVTILAYVLPALRASRIHPAESLRAE